METPRFDDASISAKIRSLTDTWDGLRAQYLPCEDETSIWCSSRLPTRADPFEGWKLHISATILTACDVFGAVTEVLQGCDALYKAPRTIRELAKLNSGIEYGYSQVGKFITVYPQSAEAAVRLAGRLHEATVGMACPVVPFDLRYRPGSCVFYRYGAFSSQAGADEGELRDPDGNTVADARDANSAFPGWVSNPFPSVREDPDMSVSDRGFLVFRALVQRGKGGVYHAVDVTGDRPRMCILKEGRRNGETDWLGEDGYRRIRHESYVLQQLREAGVPVPSVHLGFESAGSRYLAAEYIDGVNFNDFLRGRKRKLGTRHILEFGSQIARTLSGIHSAGWVWRDCKPHNFVLTGAGVLRPIDFEGARTVGDRDLMPWATALFGPPEYDTGPVGAASPAEDMYFLGAVLYLLLEGVVPPKGGASTISFFRRNLPDRLAELVAALLSPDPSERPPALEATERLDELRFQNCSWPTRSTKRGSDRSSSKSGSIFIPATG